MDNFGNPNYDAIIWLQGTFDLYSYADTTRIEMGAFLDNGGNILSTGDEVAFHLGAGGNNADSTLQFIDTYMGIVFPVEEDDETADRTLAVCGEGGTCLEGYEWTIYGECPGIRRKFDKLTLKNPPAPGSTNELLATYCSSDSTQDNGRHAIIRNTRTGAGGGTMVHTGFGMETMTSDYARASLMHEVFDGCFGLMTSNLEELVGSTDAPQVAASKFGFGLSQAAPNPFASKTSIEFSIPSRSHVSLEVYNILGQRVRTIVDETMDPNSYVRVWDGRADNGAQVSSGIYFYKLVAGQYSATKKMVHMR